MIPILTTQEARKHLRESSANDAEIDFMNAAAESIVLKHIKATEDVLPDDFYPNPDSSPTEVVVPGDVKAATALVLGELWDKRGAESNPMSDTVKDLLQPWRDPTLA